MKHSIFVGFALLALLAGCSEKKDATTVTETAVSENVPTPAAPEPRPASKAAPEDLVKRLYAAEEQPFFQTTNRAAVDLYFEKTLADLIWNDAVAANGEVGALGFDPLYEAQDTEITNFVVHPAMIEGAKATVSVTFDNFGKRHELLYTLADEAGAWKISDLRFMEGGTLRGLLTPASV